MLESLVRQELIQAIGTGLAGTAEWAAVTERLGLLAVLAILAFGWSASAFRNYQRSM